MATKQASKPDPAVIEKRAAKWLRDNDFKLWFEKKLIKETREQLETELQAKVPTYKFRALRNDACKWWKKEPRRSPTANTLLDADGWEELRAAVRKRLHDIQGRTLAEAVAIVRIECPCNAALLEGLNSDLRCWSKK